MGLRIQDAKAEEDPCVFGKAGCFVSVLDKRQPGRAQVHPPTHDQGGREEPENLEWIVPSIAQEHSDLI